VSEVPDAAARPPRIGVIGAAAPGAEDYELAFELGQALAREGAIVISGGLGGVMEAVARGARGALTVGFLPGEDPEAANRGVVLPIPTGMGEARNVLVVRASEAVVAIGGGWGTLSEIALARKMGIDVGTLGLPPNEDLGLPALGSPAEAAAWALVRAAAARTRRASEP
jgi:uncharacterized protein (TIGR00725 family)